MRTRLSVLRRPRHATVVAYLALFFAVSGTAWAVSDTGDATKVITACVAKQGGTLRIVHTGAGCGHAARKLAWNQTGPAGPPGITGPRGPQGPTGTVDTSRFYTKQQADDRYLPATATAAFAASRLFGSPITTTTVTGNDPDCMLGEVKLSAADQVLSGWAQANGQVLSIAEHYALFSVLGATYGGDGVNTFALPDLTAAEPKGNGPAGVNYYVCTAGIFP
jgi:hypothetical protein